MITIIYNHVMLCCGSAVGIGGVESRDSDWARKQQGRKRLVRSKAAGRCKGRRSASGLANAQKVLRAAAPSLAESTLYLSAAVRS